MNKLPTAEEFLNSEQFEPESSIKFGEYHGDDISYATENAMIEFAKLHVKEALKEASEKIAIEFLDLTSGETLDYSEVLQDDDIDVIINKPAILNAYPLSNIK